MMSFDPSTPHYFLNPHFSAAHGPGHDVIDPGNLLPVGRIAESTSGEITSVITAVNAAQRKWKAVDAKSRARLLHEVANAIERADFRHCAELMTREMGKPYPEAIGELANIHAWAKSNVFAPVEALDVVFSVGGHSSEKLSNL